MAALSKPIDMEEIDQGMKRSMAAVNVGTSVCLCIRTYVHLCLCLSVCLCCVPLAVCLWLLVALFVVLCVVYAYCMLHICVCNAWCHCA